MTAFSDTVATLSWALDLLDMYDERLAAIDGRERVYTDVHVDAKAKARDLLAFLEGNKSARPEGAHDG